MCTLVLDPHASPYRGGQRAGESMVIFVSRPMGAVGTSAGRPQAPWWPQLLSRV